MIVAIDGPAASGKGTIARAVARTFGLPHLDTGLLYRAVGAAVLAAGGDPAEKAAALAACGFEDARLGDPTLGTEAVGRAASIVSAHPAVRLRLLERQRAFARQPGGAVLDGRDIGTVIAPHAEVPSSTSPPPWTRARGGGSLEMQAFRRRPRTLTLNTAMRDGASCPATRATAAARLRR